MYNVGVGGKVEGWVVYFQVESKKWNMSYAGAGAWYVAIWNAQVFVLYDLQVHRFSVLKVHRFSIMKSIASDECTMI